MSFNVDLIPFHLCLVLCAPTVCCRSVDILQSRCDLISLVLSIFFRRNPVDLLPSWSSSPLCLMSCKAK
uniref:Putative secreted protein n=1 Tax=Xenopsylla cheopis TaxID=163159 RepID=A0A6M2DZG0_XENCH